jgi:hypothetical protein
MEPESSSQEHSMFPILSQINPVLMYHSTYILVFPVVSFILAFQP